MEPYSLKAARLLAQGRPLVVGAEDQGNHRAFIRNFHHAAPNGAQCFNVHLNFHSANVVRPVFEEPSGTTCRGDCTSGFLLLFLPRDVPSLRAILATLYEAGLAGTPDPLSDMVRTGSVIFLLPGTSSDEEDSWLEQQYHALLGALDDLTKGRAAILGRN